MHLSKQTVLTQRTQRWLWTAVVAGSLVAPSLNAATVSSSILNGNVLSSHSSGVSFGSAQTTLNIGINNDSPMRINFDPAASGTSERFQVTLNNLGGNSFTQAFFKWEKTGLGSASAANSQDWADNEDPNHFFSDIWSTSDPDLVVGTPTVTTTADSYSVLLPFSGSSDWDQATFGIDLTFDNFYGARSPFSLIIDLNSIDIPPPGPSAVPVPAAVWLFGTGIIGLISMGRKQRTV